MIYQNVRGLRTKQDEIFASLIDFHFDVVALTETWLSDEHCDVNLFPDCYHVFRADRDYAASLLQRGGGSAILVKSSIRCDFNVSGVCWSTRSLPANIGFYAKYKARSVFDFVDMMNLDDFTHESTDPSFCNNGLDLILTNCRIFTRAAEALVCPYKFHPPFEIGFLEVATVDVAETGLDLRYDRGDYRALYDDVRFADWCNVLLTVDLEESVMGFQKIITAAIDKHVPAFRPKSTKFPPWFNRNIVNLLKRKKAAHRRFKSSGLSDDYFLFSRLRRDVKYAIADARVVWARTCESDLCSNPRNFWKYISRQKSNYVRTPAPIVDGRTISDPWLSCQYFGEYVQSVYQDFPTQSTSGGACINNHRIHDIPMVSSSDVSGAIGILNARSAVGLDRIPAFVIKDVDKNLSRFGGVCGLIRKTLGKEVRQETQL
ncbi:uncharacterized protein LOC142329482 [Lycorma delicatula]|uniref:uncharacterized protein LOC142329482 n=1 Tax=Lycorma delicatula TaxID=130591 RepID=UPI003F517A02